ncbi:MAG: hypothetical protein ACYCYH_00155 [Steroidobacteraceae bacterium]
MNKSLIHALLAVALSALLAGCPSGGGTTAPGTGSGASGSTGSTGTAGISWTGNKGQVLGNGQNEYQLALKVQGLNTGQSFVIAVNATGGETISLSGTVTANGTYSVPGVFYLDTLPATNSSGISVSTPVTTQPADGTQCQVIAQLGTNSPDQILVDPTAGSTLTLPVLCSTYPAVTPVANEQLVPFPGVTAKVIAAPQVAPVFFSGSTDTNDYEVFLQQIVTSQYWSALQEYGVGNGTTDTAVVADTTWPSAVTESAIEKTIVSNDAWGAPITSSTVLVLFLPQGTLYEPSSADQSVACLLPSTNNCSIRGQVTIGGTPVQFIAMQPDTQNNGDLQYPMLLQHLIDAVTNPGGGAGNVAGDEGYVEASKNPDWYVGINTYLPQNQLEVGNACLATAPVESDLTLTGDPSTGNFTNLDLPYSNKAAAANTTYNYCAQAPYGLVANWSTTPAAQSVTATRFGHPVSDEALVLAPGQSTTVKMTAWQASPTLDIASGGQPFFPLHVNTNATWFYITGTNAPVLCQNDKPEQICADAPSFSLKAISTVTPVTQNGGSFYSTTAVNGNTYNLTVTASATAEPGMWVMYIGQQPIAVTNASTWQ